MSIEIRSERPGDEEAVIEVNCAAFKQRHEASLVELLRAHWPTYDRRLSIVAFDDKRMVGQAQLTPATIFLMGTPTPALALGPIAVHPEYQKKGIGAAMLDCGHDLGRREGFAAVFLNGHPSYYPRLGYKACFGFAKVTIDRGQLPEPTQPLTATPVRPADLPWLVERFDREWGDVDFAWRWPAVMDAWTFSGADAVIWRSADGQRAAYTMAQVRSKTLVQVLADDPQAARDAIATIRPEALCHHPSGWLAREALDPAWATVEATRHNAAMAIELQDGALTPLFDALNAGRPPGMCCWPMPFLII